MHNDIQCNKVVFEQIHVHVRYIYEKKTRFGLNEKNYTINCRSGLQKKSDN